MLKQVMHRSVRQFAAYKGGVLALVVEDSPGKLHSTANPGPGGPPNHPFLDASAFYTLYENEMGNLVRQASSFDHFVKLLIGAGYDIVSDNGHRLLNLNNGFRIEDSQGLVGAIWTHSGQFTSLSWQPLADELIFNYATLTVYREDQSDLLVNRLQTNNSFTELRNQLEVDGFRLVSLKALGT